MQDQHRSGRSQANERLSVTMSILGQKAVDIEEAASCHACSSTIVSPRHHDGKIEMLDSEVVKGRQTRTKTWHDNPVDWFHLSIRRASSRHRTSTLTNAPR